MSAVRNGPGPAGPTRGAAASGPRQPPVDLKVAARTMLELTATVMDAAFALLGEGVVLGTMPAYLQTFGVQNARYLERRFGPFQTATGATAALAPLNLVSQVTGTAYTMPLTGSAAATKRITQCEFVGAFEHKSPFARAMVCQLHRAIYQGSVNALLPKGHAGYHVDVTSRILFGDPHCDFEVTARGEAARAQDAPQADAPPRPLPGAETEDALAFYTAILVAFVDYLSTVLPTEALDALVTKAARDVGSKVQRLYFPGLRLADAAEATEFIAGVLASAGRTLAPAPSGAPTGKGLPMAAPAARVTACPLALPILATTKARGADAPRVRAASCLCCKEFLQGALDGTGASLRVQRDSALTLGQDDCRYRVEASP